MKPIPVAFHIGPFRSTPTGSAWPSPSGSPTATSCRRLQRSGYPHRLGGQDVLLGHRVRRRRGAGAPRPLQPRLLRGQPRRHPRHLARRPLLLRRHPLRRPGRDPDRPAALPGAAARPGHRPRRPRAHGGVGHRPPARAPARWWPAVATARPSGSACTTPARSASGCRCPSSRPPRTSGSSACSSGGAAAGPLAGRHRPVRLPERDGDRRRHGAVGHRALLGRAPLAGRGRPPGLAAGPGGRHRAGGRGPGTLGRDPAALEPVAGRRRPGGARRRRRGRPGDGEDPGPPEPELRPGAPGTASLGSSGPGTADPR